jgi:signal transduction histidine kinase
MLEKEEDDMRVWQLIDELSTAVEQLQEGERQQALAVEALVEQHHRLKTTQDQLQRAERLAVLGEFAATMAHELRNPLNVIRLAVRYINSHLPEEDERLRRHLGHLNRAVDRTCAIMDDLLAFSQLPPPNLQPVAIDDLAHETIATIGVPAQVTLDWALAADLPLVLADPRQVQRAIASLVLNAVQAMPEGGRLTISTRQAGEHVQITFCDTGPGIPGEVLKRVLEPFFSTKVTSTGLGLPLVREIAAAHRGLFSLDSAPGEGASFTLSLPVAH